MSDTDTAFTPAKPDQPASNGSTFWGISIRAWVVIMVDATVCLNWTANTFMVSLGYTSANLTVPEPLYSVFIAVNAYYFGQQIQKMKTP